ncbi:hypothetical protein EBZ39_13770 [bacterium]|nr:hypothetical protein [bacterium]
MSLMIELRALKGASVAMHRDNTRPYLCSVMVCAHTKENAGELYEEQREGMALLVSTDGHGMVVGMGMPIDAKGLEDNRPEGVIFEKHTPESWENTIIPADMVKAILRVKVDKTYKALTASQFVWLHRDGLNLRAVFFDGQVVTGKAVEASYPDWKRVFTPTLAYQNTPTCVNGLGFRAFYLEDLSTFALCFGHPKVGSVKMFGNPTNETSPVLFTTQSPYNHKGYYVLMPMRV